MLDLYDVLPAPAQPKREDDPVTAIIRDAGRRLAALIGLFFVALPAFIVCTTLFSLGAGSRCWWSACSSWSPLCTWPVGRPG